MSYIVTIDKYITETTYISYLLGLEKPAARYSLYADSNLPVAFKAKIKCPLRNRSGHLGFNNYKIDYLLLYFAMCSIRSTSLLE